MCVLSILDNIDVCVELLADYVWESGDDKPGLLSVGVDSSNLIFLYKQPVSFPMAENSNKNRKYDKWG